MAKWIDEALSNYEFKAIDSKSTEEIEVSNKTPTGRINKRKNIFDRIRDVNRRET